MSDKKYGLILPDRGKLKAPQFQAARNVFGNDSDSEEETSKKPILLRPSDITKRQSKISQEKAIQEDPTVYQYDEIYEEMVGKKEQEKSKAKEEKKPRYIENLIKSANKRKIENERRTERQIQKEREEEGEEFKDKEVFVTSAYKKKLEEMRQEEENEKREEYLERIGDVTKQRDLGGFYRHLYEQKLGTDKPNEVKKPMLDKEKDTTEKAVIDKKQKPPSNNSKRNYRKRKHSDSKQELSDGEIEDSGDEINRMNLENIRLSKKNKVNEENIDADSDFSVDDPSEVEDEVKEEGTKENTTTRSATPEIEPAIKTDAKKSSKPLTELDDKPKIVEEITPKIDIWKKRTVGEVFDEALKRYYQRKANRGL